MVVSGTCKGYIQRLNACVRSCAIIVPEERNLTVPAKRLEGHRDEAWILGRGDEYEAFAQDGVGAEPYSLNRQGQFHLYIHIRRKLFKRKKVQQQDDGVEIVAYNLKFMGLAQNPNFIETLRFDRSAGQPAGNWDDELGENIEHPWQHLHVNFHHTPAANELRLATGVVCPIVVLANFAHWYRSI